MNLLALTVSMSITASSWSIDISPVVGIQIPTIPGPTCAMTTNPIIWYEPGCSLQGNLLEHELTHIDQQAALGPVFYLAYVLAGIEPFEPYDLQHLEHYDPHEGVHDMWKPPPNMPRAPFLRIETRSQELRVSLWPMDRLPAGLHPPPH